MNYLEREFYELTKNNDEVMFFIHSSISDGVWYTDLTKRGATWMNDRFWETFGYDPKALPKDPAQLAQEMIDPEDMRISQELWTDYFAGKIPIYDQVLKYRHADGSTKHIRCRGTLIRSENGEPSRMIGIHLDVTREELMKQQEQSRRESFLKGIYKAIPGAILQYTLLNDGTDRLDFISEGVEELFGVTQEEAVQDISKIWSRVDASVIDEFRQTIADSARHLTPWLYAWKVELDGGKVRWMQGKGQPHRLETGETQWTTVLIDITEQKLLEMAKEVTEKRFEVMVNSGNDISLITTPEQLIFVSSNVERVLGYTADEFMKLPVSELFHPDDLPMRWGELSEPDSELTVEYRARHKDGKYRWLLASGINLTHLPEIGGMVFSIRDISEIKAKEEEILRMNSELDIKVKLRTAELLRSQAMLNEAQRIAKMGSWELDVRTGEVVWSEEMFVIMGIPQGHNVPSLEEHARFMSRGNFERLSSLIRRAIREGKPYELDMEIHRDDGSVAWISAKGNPVRSSEGGVIRVVGTSIDISERKKSEIELHLKSVRLEETNRELESFSYSVSHDLRAPLRGINGWSSALLEDYANILDDTAKEYVNRIRMEATQMDELIEGLLKLSKVARSEMHPELVNFSELCSRTLDKLKQLTPMEHYELQVQNNIFVKADRILLRTAIENLCSNAVKFSSKKAAPVIEAGMKILNGEDVFFIKDNGTGLDMSKASNIFSPFQRYHRKSDFDGTGIGLATVKRVITVHNGRVWMESEPEGGTTVFFTIHL